LRPPTSVSAMKTTRAVAATTTPGRITITSLLAPLI